MFRARRQWQKIITAMAMATALACAPAPARAEPAPAATQLATTKPAPKPAMTMEQFLDRLMQAESGGRDSAKNPRSSALGPFQFIRSTFLAVMRQYFPADVAALNDRQILALRTNRGYARKAAAAYTQSNAVYLTAKGVEPTFAHLRLAFLVGPSAAYRVIKAPPATPVVRLLGRPAVRANPFMVRLSAKELIARAARDLSMSPANRSKPAGIAAAGLSKVATAPAIKVPCNLGLASCRRWLAMAKRKAARSASAAKPQR